MRVPQHIVDLRREELRSLIRRDGFLPVAEICKRLGVSEATARRDLAAVEADGHITRTYGGALADYNSSFDSVDVRSNRARSAKSRIARKAVAQIPRTGTIFLDAGTTIQAVARELARRRDFAGLVVVTNSLAAATVLGGVEGLELHVLGGMFLSRQAALMGARAVEALGDWKFDVAFMAGEGMDAAGITNSHDHIANFQKALIPHAVRTFFCLDATKVGRATPHRAAAWADVSVLITDATAKVLAENSINLPAAKLIRA